MGGPDDRVRPLTDGHLPRAGGFGPITCRPLNIEKLSSEKSSAQERPSAQAVRAFGNLTLTACLVLVVLDALSSRPWTSVAVIGLAIVGTGARVEAAIHDSRERGATDDVPEDETDAV